MTVSAKVASETDNVAVALELNPALTPPDPTIWPPAETVPPATVTVPASRVSLDCSAKSVVVRMPPLSDTVMVPNAVVDDVPEIVNSASVMVMAAEMTQFVMVWVPVVRDWAVETAPLSQVSASTPSGTIPVGVRGHTDANNDKTMTRRTFVNVKL